MRTKIIDCMVDIPIEEFAANEDVSVEVIKCWGRQGKIIINEKQGREFVTAASDTAGRNAQAVSIAKGPSFEIRLKLPEERGTRVPAKH